MTQEIIRVNKGVKIMGIDPKTMKLIVRVPAIMQRVERTGYDAGN